MCGVAGIHTPDGHAASQLYDALTVLQHRGQDAAGIVTCDGRQLYQRKDSGYVRDIFDGQQMQRLRGHAGIGHVRYPTAGSSGPALAQPFYVNSPYGISLGHNGNLTNTDDLRRHLFAADKRHVNTDSDSEVMLNIFAHELQKRDQLTPGPEDIFAAVAEVHKRCMGAYACVALIARHGLVAFRDPMGIRPLVYGSRTCGGTRSYLIASESVALDMLGYELERDLAPGEAIHIDSSGQMHSAQCAENSLLRPCLFEHVYFARPDSIMDGVHMYKARLRQGQYLAQKIMRQRPEHGIDVVIPVPDTSRVASQALAEAMGIKLREGLMKNRFIGRTFIMPGQAVREHSVRQKLNVVDIEFRGKNVLLVDDSIVRGTTSRQIIQMARAAGAKAVYLASAAPPVRHPNVYGIDMPSAAELVAHQRCEKDVEKLLGCDWLIYQDLDDLLKSSAEGNADINGFEHSVFSGEYATGDISPAYLQQMHQRRGEGAHQEGDSCTIETALGLHDSRA